MDTAALVQEAVRLSGLQNFTGTYRSLGDGELNDTYLLEGADQPVVLRISKRRGRWNLAQEATSLAMLDMPETPKLLFFDEHSLLDGRGWILESYIPGQLAGNLTLEQFKKLGSLMAKIHSVHTGKVGIDIWACFLDSCKHFGDQDYLLAHPDPELRQLIHAAQKQFAGMQPTMDKVSEVLVHADITPSNILIDGANIGLIDWEFSKYKDPMSDFPTLYYDDIEYNQGKWRLHIQPQQEAALFAGYREAGGVIDEERIAVWMDFDKLTAAIFLYWRITVTQEETSTERMEQYKLDQTNLRRSLAAIYYS